MQYLILCVCFWGCAGELNIRTSQSKKPWSKLTDVGQQILDYNYIKQNGWSSILDQIPEDEEFWIAAKANATLTPFVSWEGCAKWLRGPNCTNEIKLGGSIADCIEHCSTTSQYQGYILLQDTQCRCVDKNKAETCFERTNTNLCKTMCLNNTNDRCGGTDMFVSVYLKDQFPYKLNKENGINQNCVHVNRKTQAKITSCYERKRRKFICNGSVVDHGRFLTWPQAFDECGKMGAQLGFEQPDDAPLRESFWTSMRRSFRIDWIPQIDNTNQTCVTVSKDRVHKLILKMDDCKQPHRYLYMSQGRTSTSDGNNIEEEKEIKDYIWQLGVFVVFAVCVIAVSIICYFNGQKRKERRKSRHLGIADVRGQAVQPNEAPSRPQESRCRYYTSVTLNRRTNDTPSGQPQTFYNEIGSIHNPVNSIYDRTLTSRHPLLIHCPENEYGFGIRRSSDVVSSISEEDSAVAYAVPEKRKAVPRNPRKTDASCNKDSPSVSEEVSTLGGEISTLREDDPTISTAVSRTDFSENDTEVPTVATCNSQEKPPRLLMFEMKEKLKNHNYFTLEAIE